MCAIGKQPLWFVASVLISFASVACDVSHLHNHRSIPEPHYADEGLSAGPSPFLSGPRSYRGREGKYDFSNDASGWDIRLSVPGEPERDYPLLNNIPQTSFNCVGKTDGYYADIETRCQVFRVCAITAVEGFFSFLCPNGTLFNQRVLVCDWWMNVACPEFDSDIETRERLVMPSGPALMEDIRQMIIYPTTVPAPNTNPPMKTSMQVYNPPADMFPPSLRRPFGGKDASGALKLPTNGFSPTENVRKDSYPSGLGQNPSFPKYEGIVPSNGASLPIYESDLANLGPQKAVDLNYQKVFNAQQAIKVTKQQFTYPSAFDKQYTVPATPATNSRLPLVVRVPINVATFDGAENAVSDNNESSYGKIHSGTRHSSINRSSLSDNRSRESFIPPYLPYNAVPFIVFLIKPPTIKPPQLLTNSFTNSSNNTSFHSNSVSDSSEYERNKTLSISHTSQREPFDSEPQVQESKTNSANRTTTANVDRGPHYTANVASQTNYYITTFSKKEKEDSEREEVGKVESEFEFEAQAENIQVPEAQKKPARLTASPESDEDSVQPKQKLESMKDVKELSRNVSTDNSFDSSRYIKTNETLITTNENNLTHSFDNNLVTLFSAHIIPGGDLNNQKIIKLCIPKHILTYLLSLHNATKKSLLDQSSAYTNADSINKLVSLAANEPIFKRIMQNFLMRNNFSNLQVPFTIGREDYSDRANSFEQTVGGFRNNFQQTSENLVQTKIRDDNISEMSLAAQKIQNGQKTVNSQFDAAYKSKVSISTPYTVNNEEEQNSNVTKSGFFQANRVSSQNSGQQNAFGNSQQSKFSQQNGFRQGGSITGTNQYSSKFSKDSSSVGSSGTDEFNRNTQGISEFGNLKEQIATQYENYKSQGGSQLGEYQNQKTVSQFTNYQNENIPKRNGQLTTYGTNESGPEIEREYPSQFDTASGRSPVITEIENQGEYFSIQEGPRRPANRRPQTSKAIEQTPDNNGRQNFNSNGQARENKEAPNGQNINQSINNERFNTESKTGYDFGSTGQMQNYNLGSQIQRQNQNQQNKFGQYTSIENQAKNSAAYNAQSDIKTNTQNTQINGQQYAGKNLQDERGSFAQKGSLSMVENYNDGRLISVQQQFPFIGPNNPSPFVKSSQGNGNTGNQQTSRYSAFGSTQTNAPQVSSVGIKSGQYANTNSQSGIESNIKNSVRQESTQSEYAKQTGNGSPVGSEYEKQLSYSQTSGGELGHSGKFTNGASYSRRDQINGNSQFGTGSVETAIGKFGTGPVSSEYSSKVIYNSNAQSTPVVSSGKYTQESSFSNQNRFSDNYRSDTGTLTADNKFVSNQKGNTAVNFGRQDANRPAPVQREYNQQISYTSNVAPVTGVTSGQFVSTQKATYSNRGQFNNNYQASIATHNSDSNNFKTNSQYTQSNRLTDTKTTATPHASFEQTQTFDSRQITPLTSGSQGQFYTQQKQTDTFLSTPNYHSGSFVGTYQSQNGNVNRESKYFDNSENYSRVQNKNVQGQYQSANSAGVSSGRESLQTSTAPLNSKNDNEYGGQLTSQSGFGGSPVPTARGNVDLSYENRVNYNTANNGRFDNGRTHTKVEVVPAYGFLLNSDREKQEYFTAVSRGLSNVQKIYEAPYQRAAEYTASNGDSNFGFDRRAQTSDHRSENYIPQRPAGGRDLLQSTAGAPHRPLPIEDLGGYPQERPSISFSY